MATNLRFDPGNQIVVAKASISAGDPVVFGQVPGVALTDTDGSGNITMKTDGVYLMSVKGADGSGNAAITAGDIIYLDSTELNVDSTNGVRWGYALQAVSSGATTSILVKVGY